MSFKNKILLSTLILLSFVSTVGANSAIDYTNPAQEASNYQFLNNTNSNILQTDIMQIVNSINPTAVAVKPIKATQSGYKEYEEAINKFIQGNTSVAYKELLNVLNTLEKEDFLYISIAYRYINIGFFSLASNAINMLQDDEIWDKQVNILKTKYFPSRTLSNDEEIYLGGLYSDIYFHNLAFEVIKELHTNEKLLKNSDYANYILSLAYFETKEYKKALSAIEHALSLNPENINYKKNKAQILCELKHYKEANKIMAEITGNPDNLTILKQEMLALQEYILAKTAKKEYLSKYHLGNYFHLKNENERAIKSLSQALVLKKKHYPSMIALAKIYVEDGNSQKAEEFFQKAYKLDKTNPETLFGLGDLEFKKGNVQEALNYFLISVKKNKKHVPSILYSAMCYKILNHKEMAQKISQEALALNPSNPDTHYLLSRIDEQNKTKHLKQTTSLNPLYVNAWLDLAYESIKKHNYAQAKTYLLPVKYIDSNNYKVYYYQGLIEKFERNDEQALAYFKKALSINPNFEPAQNEVENGI